jgi:hypothetical protein
MQSILDKLADAIAVFSEDGTLALTNYAYQQLWRTQDEAGFHSETVTDVTRIWQDHCVATPVLGEIRDFVDMRDDRTEWSAEIQMRNGTALDCTLMPMQNGATIVRFATASKSLTVEPIAQISA